MVVSMANHGLSSQVDAYNEWKNRLRDEIGNYRSWLGLNDLASDDVIYRLKRGMDSLKDDQLTIAFVGEYSRGKTELINALIFSQYGQRMLPSQAGRTTMCPTELFYDHDERRCYLKLLPIETRLNSRSIAELKTDPDAWHEVAIDSSDPEQLSASLMQVASTRTATVSEARDLGFEEDMLEQDEHDPSKVIVPVWRHALISLDNPLLKKGLNILDTPGLNALGSEPELTISMIPKAQAVIFLLSADTGVTASDMEIWNQYIATEDADHRAGRFAVLNKIDVLWDDLQGEKYTASSIERVRKDTAKRLGMTPEDVIPLSAKQALIARVRQDELLLKKSAMAKLEKLISQRILAQKESLLFEALVSDVSGMLASSQAILSSRLESLEAQYRELQGQKVGSGEMQNFAEKTNQEHDEHYRKLISLQSSRRLVKSQGDILQQLASTDHFNELVVDTRISLQNSWSTLGMKRGMDQFFQHMDQLVDNIYAEAKLAEKMVNAIYQRFKSSGAPANLHPKPFSVKRERQALRELKAQAKKFHRNPKMLVTEQTLVIKRFFNSFVQEAKGIYLRIQRESERWPDEALLPLMQFTLEQKKALENQVTQLQTLSAQSKDLQSQQHAIQNMIAKVKSTIDEAHEIEKRLCKEPPRQGIYTPRTVTAMRR